MFRKSNGVSNPSNHINRNVAIQTINRIDQNDLDTDIEVIKINSTDFEELSDSDELYEHGLGLDQAWRFINESRNKGDTHNGNNIMSRIRPGIGHVHNRIKFRNTFVEIETHNNDIESANNNSSQSRTHCFTTINDCLATLENENLSDNENQNMPVSYKDEIMKQNYFSHVDESYDIISTCDNHFYEEEAAMLIYPFRNRHPLSENNENIIINYPNDSPDTSSSSISVEKDEESVSYDKTFYRVSKSFQPVVIPRLHLSSCYMLPTVTEIVETNKQSPKLINELHKDTLTPTRINGWLVEDKGTSNNQLDSTPQKNGDNGTNIFSPQITQMYFNSDMKTEMQDRSRSAKSLSQDNEMVPITSLNDIKEEIVNEICYMSRKTSPKSVRSVDKPSIHSFASSVAKVNITHNKNYDLDIIGTDPLCKEFVKGASNCLGSKDTYSKSAQIYESSVNTSIPKLYLTFDSHAGKQKGCWFKRFINCIICCK